MNEQMMIKLGSILSMLAMVGVLFSITFDWKSASNALSFPISFLLGMIAGLGATFSIVGLIQRRKLNRDGIISE